MLCPREVRAFWVAVLRYACCSVHKGAWLGLKPSPTSTFQAKDLNLGYVFQEEKAPFPLCKSIIY